MGHPISAAFVRQQIHLKLFALLQKEEQAKQLLTEITNARGHYRDFINTMLGNGNVTLNASQFNKIMTDRIKNFFNSDFQIFAKKNSIFPMFNYKPANDVLDQAK
jgi:hypothetical protein